MRRALLAAALLLLGAGCGALDGQKFEPSSEETRVSGVLAGPVRRRPEDYTEVIPVQTGPGRIESILLPDKVAGQRPTDAWIELYREAMAMTPGDQLVATGSRDADGFLIVQALEVKR